MPDQVFRNVPCPSCGRKGATINRRYGFTKYYATIEHEFCGYNNDLSTFIKEIFSSQDKNVFIKEGIGDRNLGVVSSEVSSIFTLKKIIADFPQYFEGYCLTLTSKINNTCCPFCVEPLAADGYDFVCKECHHFVVPAHFYFQSLIRNPYQIDEQKQESEHTYLVTYSQKQADYPFGSVKINIARVTCRHNKFKNEPVLIVDKSNNYDIERYKEFVELLSNNTFAGFKIIEKIHPKK